MADGTKIEWTDATVNAINGCSVVSPGCTNCYAMRLAGTRLKHHPSRAGLTIDSKAGPVWNGQVRLNEEQLLQPLRWAKPRRIFWNAHGDMFHPAVPDEWIDRCFAVMALTPQHIHQVLTKRADRMRAYCTTDRRFEICLAVDNLFPDRTGLSRRALDIIARDEFAMPIPNVWIGVSVEDQARADERIPHLLQTPAAVRWLSCEPLLGPLRLDRIHETFDDGLGHSWESCLNGKRFDIWGEGDTCGHPKVDWVVVGGESGKGARPMLAEWARSLRDQCTDAAVPFFFKQWGAYLPCGQMNGDGGLWTNGSGNALLTTKAFAGRYLDRVQHDGMPG